MRSFKKNIGERINIIAFIMIIISIGLIIWYKGHQPEIHMVYFEEEEVYGIPFNVGFHWISLLPVMSLLLYVSSFYALLKCKKRYRKIVFDYTIILLNIVGQDYVYSSSRILIEIVVRKYFPNISIPWVNIWRCIFWSNCLMAVCITLYLVYKSICSDGGEKYKRLRVILLWCFGGFETIVLVIRCFTNPWYLCECAATCVALICVMRLEESLWVKYEMDCFRVKKDFRLNQIMDFFYEPENMVKGNQGEDGCP